MKKVMHSLTRKEALIPCGTLVSLRYFSWLAPDPRRLRIISSSSATSPATSPTNLVLPSTQRVTPVLAMSVPVASSVPRRIWFRLSGMLDGLQPAAAKSGSWAPGPSTRHFASREELLGRLRHAKAQEILFKEPLPMKSMWQDRRTYLMLFGLVGATGWGYSLIGGPHVTDRVFMDISIGEKPAGRVVLGLHGNSVPRASLNFLELATHQCGYGYRGSSFYEVLPRYLVVAGDITKDDGTGGVAALGPSFLKEKSNIKHGRGTLSMVVDAAGDVRSQFLICCTAAPSLNLQMVAFGKVLDGMDVIDQIAQLPVGKNGRPLQPVVIADCGELTGNSGSDTRFPFGWLGLEWLWGQGGGEAGTTTNVRPT